MQFQTPICSFKHTCTSFWKYGGDKFPKFVKIIVSIARTNCLQQEQTVYSKSHTSNIFQFIFSKVNFQLSRQLGYYYYRDGEVARGSGGECYQLRPRCTSHTHYQYYPSLQASEHVNIGQLECSNKLSTNPPPTPCTVKKPIYYVVFPY